jgi:hypothetical protein
MQICAQARGGSIERVGSARGPRIGYSSNEEYWWFVDVLGAWNGLNV